MFFAGTFTMGIVCSWCMVEEVFLKMVSMKR